MIYFDHAATSFPKSKATLDAFVYAANTYANAGRGSYEASLRHHECFIRQEKI